MKKALLVLLILPLLSFGQKEFNGIWGIPFYESPQMVKRMVAKRPDASPQYSLDWKLAYKGGFAGHPAQVDFSFVDSLHYMSSVKIESLSNTPVVYREIIALFEEKYGSFLQEKHMALWYLVGKNGKALKLAVVDMVAWVQINAYDDFLTVVADNKHKALLEQRKQERRNDY